MRKNKIAKTLAPFLVVVMLLTMATAFASNRPIDLVTGNGSPFEDGTRTNLLCFEAEPGKDAGIPISLCQKKFANFPAEGVVLNENDLIQYDIYADLLLPEGKEPNSNNFVVGGLDGTISDGTHSSAMRDFLNGTLPLWDATISSNFNGSIDTSIPYRQWKTVTVVVTGSGNGTRLTNVGPGVFAVKNSSTTDVLKYILYFDNVRIVRNGATLISLYDGEDTCNLDYFGQEYNSGGYRNYISSAGSTKLQDNFATGNIATPSGDFIALKAKSNADGSYINKALFAKVSDQSVNVASGDYISYDVYIDTQIRGVLGEGGNIYYCNTGVGGLAVKDTNGNWKGNSNIDLSSTYMKWSRQKYTFTEAATCNDWCVAINGPFQNNTEITALYDNIILYNADGSIKKVIWQDGPFIEPSSVSSPATADVKFTWSVDVYNDQGLTLEEANDIKQIDSFKLGNYIGIINDDADVPSISISIPYGTSYKNLPMSIELVGEATSNPTSGSLWGVDEKAKEIIITAVNGTTKKYTVIITIEANAEKTPLKSSSPNVIIDIENKTVTVKTDTITTVGELLALLSAEGCDLTILDKDENPLYSYDVITAGKFVAVLDPSYNASNYQIIIGNKISASNDENEKSPETGDNAMLIWLFTMVAIVAGVMLIPQKAIIKK